MNPKNTKIGFPMDISMINEIDKDIHDPSRLTILAHLYVLKETDFTYLKKMTEFTWGRLASHLDKLENAGYVQLEKKLVKTRKGKSIPRTLVSLTRKGEEAFVKYKSDMIKFFGD